MAIQRTALDVLATAWSQAALTNIPNPPIPDQAYRNIYVAQDELASGQKYTKLFDSATWNQYMYLMSNLVRNVSQAGVLPWFATQPYNEGAIVVGSDGKLYGAIVANGPGMGASAIDPVTDKQHTVWKIAGGEFSLKELPTVTWDVLNAAGERTYPDAVWAEGGTSTWRANEPIGTPLTTDDARALVLTGSLLSTGMEIQILFVQTRISALGYNLYALRIRPNNSNPWGPAYFPLTSLSETFTSGVLPMSRGGLGNTIGNAPIWDGAHKFTSTAAPTGGVAGDLWFKPIA